MRPIRLAIVAGAGVLVLCVIAVASSIANYVSHPAGVANSYVPPYSAPPAPSGTSAPVAPAAVTTTAPAVDAPPPAAAPAAPAPQPAARPAPAPVPANTTLARLIQQIQTHRHHGPHGG